MISRQNYESIDELWCFFKNSISKLTEDFVPFKYAKNNSGLPWITKSVRREIRKKERLFKKAKRSGNQNDATKFKTQRKKVKQIMKVVHDDYVNNCILKEQKSSGSTLKQKDFPVVRLNALQKIVKPLQKRKTYLTL